MKAPSDCTWQKIPFITGCVSDQEDGCPCNIFEVTFFTVDGLAKLDESDEGCKLLDWWKISLIPVVDPGFPRRGVSTPDIILQDSTFQINSSNSMTSTKFWNRITRLNYMYDWNVLGLVSPLKEGSHDSRAKCCSLHWFQVGRNSLCRGWNCKVMLKVLHNWRTKYLF